MGDKLRVLVCEDSADDFELLLIELRFGGYDVDALRVETSDAMRAALENRSWDLIIADYAMPKFSAPAALEIANASGLDLPFIIVSGAVGEDLAVDAMKAGADDYLVKGHLARLLPAIKRELDEAENRRRQRLVEQKLQESEEQLRLLVENVSDYAIIMTDPEGVITAWNPGSETITGYTAVDVMGRRIEEALPPGLFAPDDWKNLRLKMRKTGRAEDHRWLVRKDGRRFYSEGVVTVLRDGVGSSQGYAIILRDVTQRKISEEERERLLAAEREARAEAQRYNRIKDEFLATLSHELRTPLSVIVGHIELLDFEAPGSSGFRESLAAIRRNAQSQMQLINDLLDMSRIITGKLSLEMQAVSLEDIVLASITSLKLAAHAKNIEIVTDLEPNLPAVLGDAERLRQVLWNLLTNAIKFTPNGGRISVLLHEAKGRVELVVSDTGRGIDPEFLPYVFERFRQEDGSTTRRFGGLGLGLAIVRHIIELHGGTVHAESQGKGQGARFVVLLEPDLRQPRGKHHGLVREEAPKSSSRREELHDARILVIDDEDDSRAILSKMLQFQGAQVRAASSSSEALMILSSWQPDLVISDIGMPDEDGYSLIVKIRNRFGDGEKLPAIALTAYARDLDRQQALHSGFQEHLAKPVSPTLLVNTVKNLIKVQ